MTASPNQENSTPSESEKVFPVVGDVVSTSHFPRGVVFSTEYPYGISAAAINVLDDGVTEQLGLPGTIRAEEVYGIEDRWDIDRIVAAWANTWKAMSGGAEMSPEAKANFRNDLLGRTALNGSERDSTD